MTNTEKAAELAAIASTLETAWNAAEKKADNAERALKRSGGAQAKLELAEAAQDAANAAFDRFNAARNAARNAAQQARIEARMNPGATVETEAQELFDQATGEMDTLQHAMLRGDAGAQARYRHACAAVAYACRVGALFDTARRRSALERAKRNLRAARGQA